MKKLSYLLTLALVCSPVMGDVEVNRAMLGMFQPIMETADNTENPVTDAKIDLGRMLYYDTRLSKNRSVSCNTCHDLGSFGDDGLPVSEG